MNYTLIMTKVIEIFQKCNINSFPLDCENIVNILGCKLYKYSELSEAKRQGCLQVSNESMKIHNRIYYNDAIMSEGRVRFSIMHELGHIFLGHGEYRNNVLEAEANYFASNILAPRMAVHYSQCKRPKHVMNQFGLTFEAATYVLEDYDRWYRRTSHKMNSFDKLMYSQFYNPDLKKFVYSVKKCKLCGIELYNTRLHYCIECHDRLEPRKLYNTFEDEKFRAAESIWLYSGI